MLARASQPNQDTLAEMPASEVLPHSHCTSIVTADYANCFCMFVLTNCLITPTKRIKLVMTQTVDNTSCCLTGKWVYSESFQVQRLGLEPVAERLHPRQNSAPDSRGSEADASETVLSTLDGKLHSVLLPHTL